MSYMPCEAEPWSRAGRTRWPRSSAMDPLYPDATAAAHAARHHQPDNEEDGRTGQDPSPMSSFHSRGAEGLPIPADHRRDYMDRFEKGTGWRLLSGGRRCRCSRTSAHLMQALTAPPERLDRRKIALVFCYKIIDILLRSWCAAHELARHLCERGMFDMPKVRLRPGTRVRQKTTK